MRCSAAALLLLLVTASFITDAAAPEHEPEAAVGAKDAIVVKIRVLVEKGGERIPFTHEAQVAELQEGEKLYTNVECVQPHVDLSNGVSHGCGSVNGKVGPDGVYCIREDSRLVPGTYMIVGMTAKIVGADGRGPHMKYHPVDGAFTFTVPDSGASEVRVETVLSPEPICVELKGKVVSVSGAPIEGAVVRLSRAGPGDPQPMSRGPEGEEPLKVAPAEPNARLSTDADGAFTFNASPSPWFVRVEKRGFKAARKVAYITPGATIEIELARKPFKINLSRIGTTHVALTAAGILAAVVVLYVIRVVIRSRRVA